MSRPFRSALLVLALFPLGACDAMDLLDPITSLEGTYDLDRVEGRSLPYRLDTVTLADGTRCDIEVVAGSIVFEESYDGRFELQLAYRESCRDRYGDVDVEYPVETERGDFDRSGDRLRFWPDNDEYFDDFEGLVTGDGVVADIGGFDFRFEESRTGRW